MAERDVLGKAFGPLLLEAIILDLNEQLNDTRKRLVLPERTNDKAVKDVRNQLKKLSKYDWMV